MISALLDMLTGRVVDRMFRLVEQWRAGDMKREEIEAELRKHVAKALVEYGTAMVNAQKETILAEAKGESWLQRNWRPVVALTAFFSYWFVIIAYPFLNAWGWLPDVRFGEVGLQNMFWLTVTAVGGYIGGRTVEKVVRSLGGK